jgi:hypothetical protein
MKREPRKTVNGRLRYQQYPMNIRMRSGHSPDPITKIML